MFASMGATDSDYPVSFFNDAELRADSQSDISLGANWRINKTWQLNAVVGATDNSSNIEIFDYQKNIIMFTARSEFTP